MVSIKCKIDKLLSTMRFLITLLTNQNYATVENKEVPLVLLVLAWLGHPTKLPNFESRPYFWPRNLSINLMWPFPKSLDPVRERHNNVICYTDIKITIHINLYLYLYLLHRYTNYDTHQLLKHFWQWRAILAELQGYDVPYIVSCDSWVLRRF